MADFDVQIKRYNGTSYDTINVKTKTNLVEGLLDNEGKIHNSLLPSSLIGALKFVSSIGAEANITNIMSKISISNNEEDVEANSYKKGSYFIVSKVGVGVFEIEGFNTSNGVSHIVRGGTSLNGDNVVSGILTLEDGDWLIYSGCEYSNNIMTHYWDIINNTYEQANNSNYGVVKLANEISVNNNNIPTARQVYNYVENKVDNAISNIDLSGVGEGIGTVDNARNLLLSTPIENSESYIKRANVLDNDGAMKITKLGGKTIKISQKVGELPATITKNGLTLTKQNNGVCNLNGIATQDTTLDINGYDIKDAHKYLLIGCASGGSRPTFCLRLGGFGFDNMDIGNGSIFISSQDYNRGIINIFVAASTQCNNLNFRPQLFDLTAMGLDNITSADEFYSIVSDRYYEIGDYLLHANATKLESYNSNLFSGNSWRLGYGIMDDGTSEVAYSRYSYCEDYIRLLPNTQHIYSQNLTTGQYSYRVFYYDIDNRYIDKSSELNFSQTFTTPSDCHYVRLQINSTELPVLPTRCMLNVGNTALPYTPFNSVSLNIPAFNQYGLSDSIYNYIDYENKKRVQKVMLVDLGTLNWSAYQNTSNSFFVSLNDIKPIANDTITPNFICSKYITTAFGSISSFNAKDKVITQAINPTRIIIKDTTYTDVTAFRTAMSGVYLLYELATPIESDMPNLDNNPIKIFKGGFEEFINTRLPLYVESELYRHDDKLKLDSVEFGSQKNAIETVKVNGVVQNVSNKEVNIKIPTFIYSDGVLNIITE